MKIQPMHYSSTEAVVQRCSVETSQENTTARVYFVKKCRQHPALLLKRPWHRYFPVNLVKFLRTPILKVFEGEANLACLLSMKVSGSLLKALSEQLYLKAAKFCNNDKNRQLIQK